MKKEEENEKDLADVDYSLDLFKKFSTYGLILTLIFYSFGSVVSFLNPINKIKSNIQLPCINNDYKISYSFPLAFTLSPLNIESCVSVLKPLPLAPLKISFKGLKNFTKLNLGLSFFLLGSSWKNSFYLGLKEQEFLLKEGALNFSDLAQFISLPIEIEGLLKLKGRVFLKESQLKDLNLTLESDNFVIQEQIFVSDQLGNIEIPLFDFKKANIEFVYANKVLLFKKFQLGEGSPKIQIEGSIKGDLSDFMNTTLDLKIDIVGDKNLKEKLSFLSLVAPQGEKEEGFSFSIKGSASAPAIE